MNIQTIYGHFLRYPAISTDTRQIKQGSIFFALKGDRFDGNEFAEEALKSGAAFAVVSDRSLTGGQMIHVDDTLVTLQKLAHHHRQQIQIPVLAITGSNGKTTTKELITAVLSKKYRVHATAGNLNNHIGVPLTVLSVPSDTEIIVCEMGANHVGEIKFLCSLAEPTHGLITNIGNAHLEGFGSIEGVQQGKGELFEFLKDHEGFAFVNADDLRVSACAAELAQKITYGFDPSTRPQVHFKYMIQDSDQGFTIQDHRGEVQIHSSMFGHYNASNMLAAYAVGQHFQVEQNDMVESLSRFESRANRSEIIEFQGCIVVKDAYNANPTSMELALASFSEQYPNGWIVLGDMKELGPASQEAHQRMITLVTALTFEKIFLVGEDFEQAFRSSSLQDSRITTANRIELLASQWNWNDCEGKSLLLKGSRSMHLEYLLDTTL